MPEEQVQSIPLPPFTPAPTPKSAPLGGGSPKPAAPTPPPAATSKPAPAAPQKVAVNPTIDLSGKPVTPLGTPADKSDEINFEDLSARPSKSKAKAEPPAEPQQSDQTPPAPDDQTPPSEPANPFAPATEPAAVAPADDGKRRYDELSPEDAAIAKRLHNNLYRTFMDRLKKFNTDYAAKEAELAEARKAAAEASGKLIYEDPNAYRLDPDYTRVEQSYELTDYELEFCTQQLAKIGAGEAWQYISEWKDGKPVLVDVPANPDGRVDFQSQARMQRAINVLAQKQQDLQREAIGLRQRYTTAAQEVNAHYEEAEKRFFPNMAPDKLPAEEKRVYDAVMETLPRFERGRKSARMQALAAVSVYRVNKLLQAERAERERLQRLLDNRTVANPVTQRPAAPSPGQPTGVIRFADLDPTL